MRCCDRRSGERKDEKMRIYEPVLCVKSGKGFKEGNIYPMLGWNNGHHVFREDENGNPEEIILHDFGSELGSPETYGRTNKPLFCRL